MVAKQQTFNRLIITVESDSAIEMK